MPRVNDKPSPVAADPIVADLLQRVHALEDAVAAAGLNNAEPGPMDFMKSFGSMPDDEANRDAERLGRNWRRRKRT